MSADVEGRPQVRAEHDVLICGGGLVGASLALALSQLRLNVGLAEAAPFGVAGQPSFDERTTAISNGTQRIFNALGVWEHMSGGATPIRRIHVSDQGRFGFARIDAREQGLAQLGFVVVNRNMGEALWRKLQGAGVKIHAPAKVGAVRVAGDRRFVTLQTEAETFEAAARLVIAADGAASSVRDAVGIAATSDSYEQTAIIANVGTQKFHEHVAYERFVQEGSLAMLPLSNARVGLVWCLPSTVARQVLELSDADFIARLQSAFGMRLGRFTQIGKRSSYPLSLTITTRHTAERLAIVGNAAQALHPIAGQGFNLGLRDAACLAEVLADVSQEPGVDVGSAAVLARYAEWRGDDRQGIVRFTDGVVRLFGNRSAPVSLLRDVGLLLFDLAPPAKHYLAQLSLGAAGKIPRLARGGKLLEGS